jgi:dynein heavy chain
MHSWLLPQVAAGKKTQLQLEDTVLHLLSTATGSLLDNLELINTLDASKTTWEEVKESLRVAEETSRQIEVASAQYRPCSTRAAILYFVLNELAGGRCASMLACALSACVPAVVCSLHSQQGWQLLGG